MDRLAEDALGLALVGERGQLLEHDHVHEHGHEPLGTRRAARDVDDIHIDAGLLQELLHAERR